LEEKIAVKVSQHQPADPAATTVTVTATEVVSHGHPHAHKKNKTTTNKNNRIRTGPQQPMMMMVLNPTVPGGIMLLPVLLPPLAVFPQQQLQRRGQQ